MSTGNQWHCSRLVGRVYGRELETAKFTTMQTLAPDDFASLAQDGSSHVWDILVSLIYDGRKWRHIVHLYTVCGHHRNFSVFSEEVYINYSIAHEVTLELTHVKALDTV